MLPEGSSPRPVPPHKRSSSALDSCLLLVFAPCLFELASTSDAAADTCVTCHRACVALAVIARAMCCIGWMPHIQQFTCLLVGNMRAGAEGGTAVNTIVVVLGGNVVSGTCSCVACAWCGISSHVLPLFKHICGSLASCTAACAKRSRVLTTLPCLASLCCALPCLGFALCALHCKPASCMRLAFMPWTAFAGGIHTCRFLCLSD